MQQVTKIIAAVVAKHTHTHRKQKVTESNRSLFVLWMKVINCNRQLFFLSFKQTTLDIFVQQIQQLLFCIIVALTLIYATNEHSKWIEIMSNVV